MAWSMQSWVAQCWEQVLPAMDGNGFDIHWQLVPFQLHSRMLFVAFHRLTSPPPPATLDVPKRAQSCCSVVTWPAVSKTVEVVLLEAEQLAGIGPSYQQWANNFQQQRYYSHPLWRIKRHHAFWAFKGPLKTPASGGSIRRRVSATTARRGPRAQRHGGPKTRPRNLSNKFNLSLCPAGRLSPCGGARITMVIYKNTDNNDNNKYQ